jgi:large subunit ribosomal protein L15
MDLSTLKATPGARRGPKRVGRGPGSGHGKTSTRGAKGQLARSGGRKRPGFEGGQTTLHRRLPKRGFHHENRFASTVVNVDTLDRMFENGAEVSPESLLAKGLADPSKGIIKILGRGELGKKLKVVTGRISASARAKIEAAGGTVEIIKLPGVKPAAKTAKEG